MTGLRPFLSGNSGPRQGDVVVRASRFIPTNPLARMVSARIRVSKRRAPDEIREIGFQQIEFSSSDRGLTQVVLHKAERGTPNERSNNHSINIATVLQVGEPQLAVFDTARERIGATRSVSTTSLDDPDSLASIALEIGQAALRVAARLASVAPAGDVVASAIPRIADVGRTLHGTSADETIRVAQLDRLLEGGNTLFLRTRRTDRMLDPPPYMDGYGHEQRCRYVGKMLGELTKDIENAMNQFRAGPSFGRLDAGGRFVTERALTRRWASLCEKSLVAFEYLDQMWPHSLRLVCIQDGPEQYVRRVVVGEEP